MSRPEIDATSHPFRSGSSFLYKSENFGVYPVNVTHDQPNDCAWCERLYEAKSAELILYGRALGLSHSEAEDVLHDTFVGLMQRSDAPANPEHYCVRAYRNRAMNYRRSLWRRLTRELESSRWFESSGDESPEAEAAMQCLTQLPAEQREVIVLKIWHRYTFETIGELLDLSPNTVAGRYRYGLQKLNTWLRTKHDERLEVIRERITLLETAPSLGQS